METNQTVEEGKTMAIISYVTIIGLIIAFVSNNSKPNEFTSFHIRQSLGIFQDIFKNIWVRIVSLEKEQFCTLRFLFYRYGKTHALTRTQLPTFRY